MIIWTIQLKTNCQSNTHCVDSKDKIEPYIKKCMKDLKKSNRYLDNKYIIKDCAEFAYIHL